MHNPPEVRPVAAVIVCSDSVAAGRSEDHSGAVAADLLRTADWPVDSLVVVPDEEPRIVASVRDATARGARLIVITGGTGLGPRDVTVAALRSTGAGAVPGIGEAIRAASRARVPTTDLSRTTAFTLDGALVVCLPGSPGGVRDGLAVVLPLAQHAVAMMDGGGHRHCQREDQPAAQALVTAEPIDLPALVTGVGDSGAGAIVTFEGRVRNQDHGRDVIELTYSAHPDAGEVFAGVLRLASDRAGVYAVAGAHRVGPLAIGDLAFAVVVSAGHRSAAFETCAWVVEEVKRVLPVWKLQRFADGTQEWVNCA